MAEIALFKLAHVIFLSTNEAALSSIENTSASTGVVLAVAVLVCVAYKAPTCPTVAESVDAVPSAQPVCLKLPIGKLAVGAAVPSRGTEFVISLAMSFSVLLAHVLDTGVPDVTGLPATNDILPLERGIIFPFDVKKPH
jgi:hypothetical protein